MKASYAGLAFADPIPSLAAMPDLTELIYYAKKWYALYPGVVRPTSGGFLVAHYERRRKRRGMVRTTLDAAIGLGFKAWIPLRARAVQRKFGLSDAWRRQAIRIARERFADPNDIALFRIERGDELDGYIRRFEDAALNKLINPLGWSPDCVLVDKERFYRRCAEHGLPHPEVVAIVSGGQIELRAPANGRPLIVKPYRGEGGRGVTFVPDTVDTADPAAFTAYLRETFGGRGGLWIVQRRIAPHPALGDLALNALPTVRMTTIINPDGEPEVANCVLRFPSDPAAAVDNMKAGGILSPVDIETGALGLGCKGYGGGDYEAHPVTGARIPGRLLPDWEAAKALVIRAHREAFDDYALIGWDVALSPEGPGLIEGNAKPGVLMPQRSGRRGLGNQRYGELLAYQLAKADG